jgi:hypothetical protein
VLIAVVLGIVNLIDYAPYGLALRRVRQLTAEDLAALAAACTRHETRGHQRLFGQEIPAEFRALKPVRVSIYPGSSDISLLGKEERYVFLRVSTSKENQDIHLVSSSGRRQRQKLLWETNPEFTRRVNPVGRLVTVSQWGLHDSREWIVLADRLLVIDRNSYVGGSDAIVADYPLRDTDREAIRGAIATLPSSVRGQAFDSGVMDGIGLKVSFSADGSPNNETDILLQNVWRSEVETLLNAISAVAGKDHWIGFASSIEQMDFIRSRPEATSMSLADYEELYNAMPLPWWCWWPRFDP